MIDELRDWFRRNAYGRLTVRIGLAVSAAGVSIVLSFLPYDTILQAFWVVVSSLVMGFVVLRQRLNETDERRYNRLVNARFNYLINNDPEALNTVFADNLRSRVFQWLHTETGVDFKQFPNADALDSLAKNGDLPGQLILRLGLNVGSWIGAAKGNDHSTELKKRLGEFVEEHESLLGDAIDEGIYFRRIRLREALPTGIHLFHRSSKLLFAVKYYDEEMHRHSISLSAKAVHFEGQDAEWERFKEQVFECFPEFQPVSGGSGPQKARIPFFVGPINQDAPDEDDLRDRLKRLATAVPVPANVDVQKSSQEPRNDQP